MIRGWAIAVLIIVGVAAGPAQGLTDSIEFNGEAERSFVAAMRTFLAQEYDSAASLFLTHLREYPRSHRTTGAFVMGGKALHEARRYRESIRLLKDLQDLYPESLYGDDAAYTLGLNYFSLQRYEDAAEQFIAVRATSVDTVLVRRSREFIDRLVSGPLPLERVRDLLARADDDALRTLVALRLAERVQRAGDIRGALDVLQRVAGVPSGTPYLTDVRTLRQRLEAGRTLSIGVAMPLMLRSARPGVRELGVEFLDGIRIAVDQFNAQSISKVVLDVRDTERDASVAAREVTSLTSDDRVVAILGPVSSTEAFAAAGIAQATGVPLLTPTATSNGIAAIGPYIFQANPDYDIRGRAMAAYAFRSLGARTFAVLAPTDAVGKLMADAFIDEVQKTGGDLVNVQWYYAGSTDLRSQLSEMRRIALERKVVPYIDFAAPIRHRKILEMVMAGASQRTIDSLMERGGSMSLDSLFGAKGKALADSLELPLKYREIKIDSLAIPVDNIDAIFVPIATSDEIAVVSSQLKLYNFTGAVLGTGDWYELPELDRNRRYTMGTYFSVDTWFDEKDSTFAAMAGLYTASVRRPPTANAVMGYDAASLVLQTIARGATLRAEVAEGLSQVRGYRGIRSVVSFTPSRVNGFLTILRYTPRGIVKAGEIDVTIPWALPEAELPPQ